MFKILRPFLIDSIYIGNEANGTYLLIKPDELRQLVEELLGAENDEARSNEKPVHPLSPTSC